MPSLEVSIGPPLLAAVVEVHRFREELVAVRGQALDIDLADLHRPEASTASLVAQIGVLVGGADEDALARLCDLHAAIARPVPLDLSCDECLEMGVSARLMACISPISISHLPRKMLRHVLAVADLRQVVGEELAAEDGAGR